MIDAYSVLKNRLLGENAPSFALATPCLMLKKLYIICIGDPMFDVEKALHASIQNQLVADEGFFGMGGIFSLSPFSTPSTSRCPSPGLSVSASSNAATRSPKCSESFNPCVTFQIACKSASPAPWRPISHTIYDNQLSLRSFSWN